MDLTLIPLDDPTETRTFGVHAAVRDDLQPRAEEAVEFAEVEVVAGPRARPGTGRGRS